MFIYMYLTQSLKPRACPSPLVVFRIGPHSRKCAHATYNKPMQQTKQIQTHN